MLINVDQGSETRPLAGSSFARSTTLPVAAGGSHHSTAGNVIHDVLGTYRWTPVEKNYSGG